MCCYCCECLLLVAVAVVVACWGWRLLAFVYSCLKVSCDVRVLVVAGC